MNTTQTKATYFDCHKMTDAQKAFVKANKITFCVTFANEHGFMGKYGSAYEVQEGVFLCSRALGIRDRYNLETYHQIKVNSVREAMAFVIGKDNGPKKAKEST